MHLDATYDHINMAVLQCFVHVHLCISNIEEKNELKNLKYLANSACYCSGLLLEILLGKVELMSGPQQRANF